MTLIFKQSSYRESKIMSKLSILWLRKENNFLYLATEMVKLGHEVHVFTSDRRDGQIIKEKEGMINGIHIHRSRTLLRYKYYLELNPEIIGSILKYKDLDVLHIHSFGFVMYDIAFVLKKLLGDKTVII